MDAPLNDDWLESLVYVVIERYRYYDSHNNSWQLGEIYVFTSEKEAIDFAKIKDKADHTHTYTVYQVLKNDKTDNSAEIYET
jgi:hypothetical protein